jgi:hypothetical protein
VLKCKASSVKTKLENVRASILQRKQCERLTDVVGMPFAQPIKAGLDLVGVARAISCKDILEWVASIQYQLMLQAGDYMELPFTWSTLRDQLRTEYPNHGLKKVPISLRPSIALVLKPLSFSTVTSLLYSVDQTESINRQAPS